MAGYIIGFISGRSIYLKYDYKKIFNILILEFK